jgi:heme/copper-type cytochrome/quinol oxidase subunit 3
MSRAMPRSLIVLFMLMTTATFAGPLAISAVLRGGSSPEWPPDRAVEWVTLAGTSTLVVALIIITITASIAIQRRDNRAKSTRNANDPMRSPREAEREP